MSWTIRGSNPGRYFSLFKFVQTWTGSRPVCYWMAQGRDDDQSRPSITQVKNEYSHTSTPHVPSWRGEGHLEVFTCHSLQYCHPRPSLPKYLKYSTFCGFAHQDSNIIHRRCRSVEFLLVRWRLWVFFSPPTHIVRTIYFSRALKFPPWICIQHVFPNCWENLPDRKASHLRTP